MYNNVKKLQGNYVTTPNLKVLNKGPDNRPVGMEGFVLRSRSLDSEGAR